MFKAMSGEISATLYRGPLVYIIKSLKNYLFSNTFAWYRVCSCDLKPCTVMELAPASSLQPPASSLQPPDSSWAPGSRNLDFQSQNLCFGIKMSTSRVPPMATPSMVFQHDMGNKGGWGIIIIFYDQHR